MERFEYFHEQDILDYAFYMLPKQLFVDPKFSKLSIGSKVLYSILMDRLLLSKKNGWIDDNGNVYIYFTIDRLQELLPVSHTTMVKWLQELDSKKGIGLIDRFQQGLNKPAIIYVKNFQKSRADPVVSTTKGVVEEDTDIPKIRKPAFQKVEVRPSKKWKARMQEIGSLEFQKVEANDTEEKDTDRIDTEGESARPQKEKLGRFKNVVLTKKEYQSLRREYPSEYLKWIEYLSGYMVSTGKKYQNHYATIVMWAEEAKEKSNENNGGSEEIYQFEEGECL